MIDTIHQLALLFVDYVLHLDVHLVALTQAYGFGVYAILFLIIFAETGLVVTPFLPGDSLLFAVGAVAGLEGSNLKLIPIWMLLICAAFLGDNLNYQIGKRWGRQIFSKKNHWLLNPDHLKKTELFYERHGKQAVVLARFMPIFRTFAPFVAGLGRMKLSIYMFYSLFGSFVWMTLFIGAGYMVGNNPVVKSNFHFVIILVVLISLLPIVYGYLKKNEATR